jgi:serine phosphatase RsbU (regulator of sigma subunit)
MREAESGFRDDVETDEERRLVGFSAVPGTNWMVIVDRDYSEVVGSLDTALWVEIGALALLAILGVFATFAFARRLDRLDEMRDAALTEQRTIALELQSSMLPELPHIEGISIDAGYVPAQGGMSVGGDWYDVVDMGDGRVAVSVGDVAGHGLQSAAIMGQLRSAVRALALARDTPAEALVQLDKFIATLTGRPLATVVYGTFDLETRELRYACAGHPPPLVVHGNRATMFLEDGRSPLLGVDDGRERPEGVYTLAPDDTLVIYTDGLVERPEIPIDEGLAELSRRVSSGARTAELLASVAEPRRDDVAVLCLSPAAQPSSVAS